LELDRDPCIIKTLEKSRQAKGAVGTKNFDASRYEHKLRESNMVHIDVGGVSNDGTITRIELYSVERSEPLDKLLIEPR